MLMVDQHSRQFENFVCDLFMCMNVRISCFILIVDQMKMLTQNCVRQYSCACNACISYENVILLSFTSVLYFAGSNNPIQWKDRYRWECLKEKAISCIAWPLMPLMATLMVGQHGID